MGGFSIWHLLVLLLVVVLVFGTGKIRHMGSDLGQALRDFKKGLNSEDEHKAPDDQAKPEPQLRAEEKQSADATESARQKEDRTP